jgi:DNA-binding NtrC family response regulator
MGLKVLVVDDDKCSAEIFKAYLDYKEEWAVDTTNDPLEALEILSSSDYDIVVSDLRMEPMNGMIFLSQVSAKYPKTVRLLFSGSTLSKEKPSYIHFQYEKGNFSMVKLVADVTKKLSIM